MTRLASNSQLIVGSPYRVDGILHDYLGQAMTPETGKLVHAFRRREWRPDTPGQHLVTLVAEDAVERSVSRFGGRPYLSDITRDPR